MNYTVIRLKTNNEGGTATEVKDFQSDLDGAKSFAYTAMADACAQKRPYDAVLILDNAGNMLYHDVYSKPVVAETPVVAE